MVPNYTLSTRDTREVKDIDLKLKGPDKLKLKDFVITKPLYEMLKGLTYEKEDKKYEQWNDNKLTVINNQT